MADIKIKYASAAAVTITLTSLADGSARQSDEISNTTNLYDDVLLRVSSNGLGGSTANLRVYVFASVATGNRSGGAGATDAAFTGQLEELRLLGFVKMNGTTAVTAIVPGVASVFGGIMPEKWGIVIHNASGAALSATAGDHDVDYQGIHYQTV